MSRVGDARRIKRHKNVKLRDVDALSVFYLPRSSDDIQHERRVWCRDARARPGSVLCAKNICTPSPRCPAVLSGVAANQPGLHREARGCCAAEAAPRS